MKYKVKKKNIEKLITYLKVNGNINKYTNISNVCRALKTSANTVLTSTAQQITDGSGNNSIMFLSTAGVGIGGSPASGKELDVTGKRTSNRETFL
ncbi:MAG: hypothetical protein CM15mV88_070 [Caudoviricetes sp.]|nr:MAG: hypothetical protein CM15mV88_070 [Caudoviricetes sp.]